MKKILALLLCLFVSPVFGQGTFPLNNIPLGLGLGKTGWAPLAPGSANNCVVSNGTTWTAIGCPGLVGSILSVDSIANLKAVAPVTGQAVNLTAAGRTGLFNWTLGNYTTAVATDTNNGIYVKANSVAASTGAFVRQFDFLNYNALWFGPVADYSTDNAAIINTIIATTSVPYTQVGAGRQGAAEINIPASVRFSSTGLSFTSPSGYVYINLNYFANSDLTKGVPTGGGGTNEYYSMSINSGYPDDPSGAFVAERRYLSFVQPTLYVEQESIMTGADTHFKCSVPLVLGQCLGVGQTRVPTSLIPVNTTLAFAKDNFDRAFFTVSNYGDNGAYTGLTITTYSHDVSLAGQAGFSSTAWCGGACIPVVGNTVQGAISGALGYLTSAPAGDVLTMRWLSGVFQPGEAVISNGNSTAPTTIGGGGVLYTGGGGNSPLWFGINDPKITLGIPPGSTLGAMTIGGRFILTNTAGVFGVKPETTTNAALLFTNTSTVVPTTGRQVVLDSSNRLCTVNGVAIENGSNCTGLVSDVGARGTFNGSTTALTANSFNITSVAYLGSSANGYQVNITNSLGNSNYQISWSADSTGNFPTFVSKTTSSFIIKNFNAAAAPIDVIGKMDFVVNGGQ